MVCGCIDLLLVLDPSAFDLIHLNIFIFILSNEDQEGEAVFSTEYRKPGKLERLVQVILEIQPSRTNQIQLYGLLIFAVGDEKKLSAEGQPPGMHVQRSAKQPPPPVQRPENKTVVNQVCLV